VALSFIGGGHRRTLKKTTDLSQVVVAVFVWQLDLQLPLQSVLITTDVVSLNLDQSEVYNIM
jgi:hypothetical protein